MNLVQMLSMTVTPLPEVPGTRTKGKGKHKNHTCEEANKARHSQTLARYREKIGIDWLGTRRIEERVGVAYRSSYETLNRWYELGILERRPAGGKVFAHQRGWEWRFKDEGK